eukprot:TRINITY_DN63275_c0_g1_i1.p1 TRINITY_DN63275_c0_g1~~TRINITY_DN63275_c0_g1_i1.p1  ORF type:complete len:303 (-),score=88.20 TRINITY_DN63275_c0_g1_i1:160-1068(-)
MGGKCCSDRGKKEEGGNVQARLSRKQSERSFGERKSVHAGNAYDTKKRAISIGYHSKGDDAEKFDRAFEKNDLPAFVALLSSQQAIESFEERMHPWAEDPKTVGALAGTQLAILASVAEKDNPGVKDDIRKAGAISPLVDFLKSDASDRQQTAVVALSFLTSDCPENAREAHKAGAMPLLLKHMDSSVAGMRAAAATTLRNICMESDENRKEFVDMGGLTGLVNQLDSKPDPNLNHADVQLEAVLNLQDMIENEEDGSIIEEYARKAIAAGAIEKLKKLCKEDDEEVQSSAEEVLAILSRVK